MQTPIIKAAIIAILISVKASIVLFIISVRYILCSAKFESHTADFLAALVVSVAVKVLANRAQRKAESLCYQRQRAVFWSYEIDLILHFL